MYLYLILIFLFFYFFIIDFIKPIPFKKLKMKQESLKENFLKEFFKQIEKQGELPSYWYLKDNKFESITWNEYQKKIFQYSKSLLYLGLQKNDKICIYSKNIPEYSILIVSCMIIGVIPIIINYYDSIQNIEFIIKDSKTKYLFIQNQKLYMKLKHLNDIKYILFQDNINGTISLKEFLKNQKQKMKINEISQQEIILIQYYNQEPKILLYQDIILSINELSIYLNSKSIIISYYPMMNIFQHLIYIYFHLLKGYQIYYIPSFKLLFKYLKIIRPTLFFGLPFIYHHLMKIIQEKMNSFHLFKYLIYYYSMSLSSIIHLTIHSGNNLNLLLKWKYKMIQYFIFHSIKESLGFDRTITFLSMGNLLSKELLEYYSSLDIPIYEIYFNFNKIISMNLNYNLKFGSLGKLLNKNDILLNQENQLLFKNNNQFIDSGFNGYLDKDEFLWILKNNNNIITLLNEYIIHPILIENNLLLNYHNIFKNVCLIGDSMIHLILLIELNLSNDFILKMGFIHPLEKCKKLNQFIYNLLKHFNIHLGPFERIKNFKILKKIIHHPNPIQKRLLNQNLLKNSL